MTKNAAQTMPCAAATPFHIHRAFAICIFQAIAGIYQNILLENGQTAADAVMAWPQPNQ